MNPDPTDNRSEVEKPRRVIIVDDSSTFRQALRRRLGVEPVMRAIGERPDGAATRAMVESPAAQPVLMDARMSGMNGIRAGAILRGWHPQIGSVPTGTYLFRVDHLPCSAGFVLNEHLVSVSPAILASFGIPTLRLETATGTTFTRHLKQTHL